VDADALLAQLPADWKQWPEELKAAVVQAILEAQHGE
jgi:hypothetical protein